MSKDTLENLEKFWGEEIAEIKKEAIDNRGVYLIYLQFQMDTTLLVASLGSGFTREIHLELDMLESKLTIALETARSRFKLQNRGLWARIIEGIGGIIYKIPKR